MRQFFKYGSVRGAASNGGPYRDLIYNSINAAKIAGQSAGSGTIKTYTESDAAEPITA